MNKRIRELAEQAGFFPVPDETESDLEYRAENARYEKFAELILKEVFNACDMCEPQANPEYVLCEMFGIDHNWRLLDERKN